MKLPFFLTGLLSASLFIGSAHSVNAQPSADTGEFRRIEQPLGLKLGVAAAGMGLIGLELWWFLLSKTRAQTAQVSEGVQSVNITVDGGYSPDQIVVRLGQPVRLNFLRTDSSSCLDQVIFADFHKAVDLPLNQTVAVELLPDKSGNYTFHCGMNMFRGTLTVEAAEGASG